MMKNEQKNLVGMPPVSSMVTDALPHHLHDIMTIITTREEGKRDRWVVKFKASSNKQWPFLAFNCPNLDLAGFERQGRQHVILFFWHLSVLKKVSYTE